MNTDKSLTFVHLNTIPCQEFIELMNHKDVGKQMPLLSEGFSEETYQGFLEAKTKMWQEHGYGPWAFKIDGQFAGWGGLQAEQGDVDFALVLHPNYWGWGRIIYQAIINQAFNSLNMSSITILFPPTRTNWRAITKLGFKEDGTQTVNQYKFTRYRLLNPQAS